MTKRRIPVLFNKVFTSRDVAEAGVSNSALSGWRARGEVIELAPGVFVPSHLPVTPQMRAIFAGRAIAEGREPLTIAGAAARFGIATPPDMRPAHRRVRDAAPIPPEYLIRESGLLTPTPAWTAIQLARAQRLEGALIPLDSALRNGVDRAELAELASRVSGWSGTALLRQAIDLADSRAGSALESYSRGVCIQGWLPMPELQHPFQVWGNRYYVDFWWPEFGVVGEADGNAKYEQPGAIVAEKRRQAALHSFGLHVVRWGWEELRPSSTAFISGLRALLTAPAATAAPQQMVKRAG